MASDINSQTFSLPTNLSQAVEATLDDWRAAGKVRKLWARDPSLWTNRDEDKWLGWLDIVAEQQRNVRRFTNFAAEVRDSKFSHVLLLGMGGSSLCPEVMRKSFGKIDEFPELHVLDSTDPAQIKTIESNIDLANTLFIVSSKSGTTLEPNIFKQYFFERARQVVGDDEVGNRFIAITDPGSKLRQAAESDRFRKIFLGVPSIGGRYSALSDFGLAPAAATGIDVVKFLDHTSKMVDACRPEVAPLDNPGVILGAVLGVARSQHRDKVTIIASPGIYDLGAWLEQLLAESTGKNGNGLIPVDRESLGPPDAYGGDRLFVYLRLEADPNSAQDEAIDALKRAGQPVAQISITDVYNLGQEFFRWEIATAVAGSIIGINPFDQPDVEASKIATKKLTEEYERNGSLPAESPMFEADGVKLFADDKNARALNETVSDRSLNGYLKAHLDRLQAGDYFALLAYVEMNGAHEQILQSARHAVRNNKHVATCLGFGPRFLHSTGQAYKGGPNSGVFLQITCDDAVDLPVPGQKYTFGIVKAAQARGDFEVLAERGRRALRVHLGADVNKGLAILEIAIRAALA
ncbi:MAG: transaldolase / glucose-6-phosphate isomerase [Blastocatellia bacterium]|jgi:transaldolase/glucose-6-phosphate isomerase|nr:transaldolase / glucose-6-phosphate isomerase [Blastocatellia bacterium]